MVSYKDFQDVKGGRRYLPIVSNTDSLLEYCLGDMHVAPANLPFPSVRDKYGYPSLYYRKTARRLQTDFQKFQLGIDHFLSAFGSVISGFDQRHLLTSYDTDVVLPATCGLSYVPTLHFDIDEKGELGHSRRFLFPTELVDYVIGKYAHSLSSLKVEPSLSMKRGTNLGWPTQKSNSGRLERDVLLALHAAFALGAYHKGLRLQDAVQFLSQYHGQAFAVAGERLQHTDRVVPYFASGRQGYTWHIQPRVRGIYFSPKFCVAWNRPFVKRFLHAMMNDAIHAQDRSVLKSWFTKHLSSEWELISIDVSRFDQSLGGQAGDQILKMIAASLLGLRSDSSAFDNNDILADFRAEFFMPTLVRTARDLYLTKGGEILSSGLSMTSLVGSVYSECIAYYLANLLTASFTEAFRSYGSGWSALTWGDDIVFAAHKTVLAGAVIDGVKIDHLTDALPFLSKKLELEFTEEPTVKFLGQNYHMRSYTDAKTSYPVGRFLQQQYFPEREKKGPNATIGFLARLQLLDESYQKDVFDVVMGNSTLARVEPFSYAQKDVVLATAVDSLLSDSSDISVADDVLNVFTHGMEPDDLLGIDTGLNETYLSLLAQSSAKLDDPVQFLRDEAGFKDSRILTLINSLRQGELSSWIRALQTIKGVFGGSLNRNDSYY